MRNSTRNLSRIGATAALAITVVGLTACTGVAEAATPDEVFKTYVSALNAGDVDVALSYVADSGDITSDNSTRLDELGAIPEPKLAQELELDEKIESTTVSFVLGTDSFPVDFVKNEGAWQIREPLFFEESRAADAKSTATDLAGDGRSQSTWWEVVDQLDISVKLPSGDEFDFPQYIAGVAPGEHQPIPLTLSDLPGWEYLQETPFEQAELTIVNHGGDNQGYSFDATLATDPLRDDIKADIEALLPGQTTTYTTGGGFMRSGTEHTVQLLDAAGGCASNLHRIPSAPDLETDDWKAVVFCDFTYSDTQFPGETKENRLTVLVDRNGAIDEESVKLDSLGVGAWG